MTQRLLCLFTALTVLGTACSGDDATEPPRPSTTSTSTSTTSTTLPPTTTTTTVRLTIDGAPAALTSVIEDFYAFAAGVSNSRPPAPRRVVESITPGSEIEHSGGTASVATFQETPIAVVETGSDTFLAVRSGNSWRIVGGEWPSLSVPAFYGDGPRVVAVVGSDARPGQDREWSRADSIHFVGLDSSGDGAVIGLPRDSYVPVPGFGRRKITTSLSLGGPDTMMAAFEDLTDLPLEGYVLTGFAGFESLLGTVLGGVEVDVPFSISDRWAHVSLRAGEQMLSGAQALGFARARKTVPGGDFTRSEHQGVILLAAARAVRDLGMAAIPELLELSEPYLSTNLSPAELLTFSARAVTADLDNLPNVVAPGSPGSAGSASVVYLASSAEDLFADLEDGRLDDQ